MIKLYLNLCRDFAGSGFGSRHIGADIRPDAGPGLQGFVSGPQHSTLNNIITVAFGKMHADTEYGAAHGLRGLALWIMWTAQPGYAQQSVP